MKDPMRPVLFATLIMITILLFMNFAIGEEKTKSQWLNENPCMIKVVITNTEINAGTKKTGKVRDQYDLGDKIALITTDRQSAFDRVLASIPYKGQVLNLTSAWWFEKTRDIIQNQIIDIPDPNVTLAKKCYVFRIEFVVR